MPITLCRASTYHLPEHRNAVDFGTERLRRVTGVESEFVRSLIAVFIGRPSLIYIGRRARRVDGRTTCTASDSF